MEFLNGATVGIDLGTTFSTLAIVDEQGEPTPIPNEDDDVETASLILLAESKRVIVGPNRSRAAMEDPENVIERIKRQMGAVGYARKFDGHDVTPEFVSSLILRKLKQDAERRIGQEIVNAVITVPYYFNDTRRKSTQDAGRIAGLNVVSIINEPTAAALTYAWHRGELGHTDSKTKRRILIYDLGGGTFDSTVVEYSGTNFHVVSTDGDVKLGGVDWNDRLADYVCEKFLETHGVNLHQFPKVMQILRNDCDVAKIQLTTRENTTITCRYEGKSVNVPVTRELFEKLTHDLLQRTLDTAAYVVQTAGMTFADLDAIVAVGGSTMMPQVPAALEKLTGKAPYKNPELSPFTAVARGAAIHAAILEAQYNKANTTLSDRVKKLLENVHEEDVNSHGLGVVATDSKTKQVVNAIMIPRNTTLPFSITKTFQTVKDGQSRISVQIMEGDAPDPTACSLLGKCRIVDLPENLPKGTLVEVSYSFDKVGRISVSAREKATGREARIELERRGVLTESDVERFIALADEYSIE
ncbi:MAG: Hsp70 family protein [Thermoguttaceae bacterium]|nr:Hsp70 family protein [Thermoguttaceae bacterium]